MPKIAIPTSVQDGFLAISKLNEKDIEFILSIITKVDPGDELDGVEERLVDRFGKSSSKLLQTIVSFSGLVEKGGNTEQLAIDLASSFTESLDSEISANDTSNLKNNLLKLLTNINSLQKSINSKKSLYDNESLLRSTKIITDLRILFQDDLSDKNRDGLIIHKLHVEYNQNFESKEIYFTLDLKDLNKLKSQIEKALEKDHILRNDFNDKLNILF